MAVMNHAQPQSDARAPRTLLLITIIVALVAAAAIGGITFASGVLSSADGTVPGTTSGADNSAGVPAGAFAPAAIDANDRLLVWVGTGAAPGAHSASDPGQLVLINGSGELTTVLDIPQQTTRVVPCGDQATSPDGRFFAFMIATADAGALYLMDGTQAPAQVASMHTMGCIGSGTFQWSPDSSRFGYISYEPGAAASEFADGFLYLWDAEGMSQLASFENTVSFDITADNVAFLQFFTNDRDEADEAAVLLWNGSAEREIATLRPEEDCRFSSGEVGIAPDGRLIVVVGHRCRGVDGTEWQLYVVDPETRSAALVQEGPTGGQFGASARSNELYFAPDGSTVFFTIPDGVTLSTVSLRAMNLETQAVTTIVERSMVMPKYDNFPYAWNDNAPPLLSNDGNWLAFVVNTPQNDATLNVFDLRAPDSTPIAYSAGSRGDAIGYMAFTQDSTRLLFVSGGSGSANNSLSALDVSTGGDFRVSRGRFGRGAVAGDGSEIVVMDWQVLEDPQQPVYVNLVVYNINDSSAVPVFTGADVVDGEVTNQRFAYPLTWR